MTVTHVPRATGNPLTAACGVHPMYKNCGNTRAGVTCKRCKTTPEYMALKPAPKSFRAKRTAPK